MKVSILSDEISWDPVTACEIAAGWGLKHLEFRLWMNQRAPEGMSETDMRNVRKAADDFGLDFPSISPGLFKLYLDDPKYSDHQGDFRERCFDLAQILGAGIVVIFPPIAAETDDKAEWPQQIVDDFRAAADAAAARGLMLAAENEPVCFAGAGQLLAQLVAEVNHPNLRANWDPGNHAWATGESFRTAYEALKPWQVHCHVKDVKPGRPAAAPPGTGICDWPGQLAALKVDGYQGLLVLETHFVPKVAGSRDCYERLCRLLSEIGEEAQ